MMKKIAVLTMLITLALFNAQAQKQELVSKNGIKILPESGDYAIGVDFAPIFKSLNFFGGTSVGPEVALSDGLSIFGKYYNDNETAFRVKFAFNRTSKKLKNYVLDESEVTNTYPENVILDKSKVSYSEFYIGGGIEKRRGYGRLQGYYGGELFIGYGDGTLANPNQRFEYGNEFSSSNTNPISTTDFVNGISSQLSDRTTKVNQGGTFGIGARGFVGVEYFFAPKISIGGELGWGLAFFTTGEGTKDVEHWDPIEGAVVKETTKTAGNNKFTIGTDGASNSYNQWVGLKGNINIIFHF